MAFDGRIHHLEEGYWLKFEIKRVPPTSERPHGLRYSFTLHDPDGKRLIGFDNAHEVTAKGSGFRARSADHDHWHRTSGDPGRPYSFTTADKLLEDFFSEVRRELATRNISENVLATDTTNRSSS